MTKFIKIDWLLIPVTAIERIHGDICKQGAFIEYTLADSRPPSLESLKKIIREYFNHGECDNGKDFGANNAEFAMTKKLEELFVFLNS